MSTFVYCCVVLHAKNSARWQIHNFDKEYNRNSLIISECVSPTLQAAFAFHSAWKSTCIDLLEIQLVNHHYMLCCTIVKCMDWYVNRPLLYTLIICGVRGSWNLFPALWTDRNWRMWGKPLGDKGRTHKLSRIQTQDLLTVMLQC